jgi:cysteine-rich repeat protein
MRTSIGCSIRFALFSLFATTLFACGNDGGHATPDAGPPDPTCTDGIKNGIETDVDCGGVCGADHQCADAKLCFVAADCMSGVCEQGTCQAPACDDGVVQAGEMCDDGNNTNGDGCDDGPGGSCRPTGCGNGTKDPTEQCDDGNAVNGDGCDNNCKTTGCGNGVLTGTEVCDDGNAVNNDGCNTACMKEAGFDCVTTGVPSVCTAICGDGMILGNESCDDMNTTPGDGCNMCQIDLGCAAGETAVVLTNATSMAIPDNDQVTGATSSVTVPTAGAVTKIGVQINHLTHTYDGDINAYLAGPSGLTRALSLGHGGTDENYVRTLLDDSATATIASGTAPFTGRFRPDASLSTTQGVDFKSTGAAGTWSLHVYDDSAADTGTLDSWTLFACVNPTAPYCGNSTADPGEECDDGNTVDTDACNNNCQVTDGCGDGNLDAGEECDDNNLMSSDGCSSTCHVELTCPTGSTAVTVSNATSFAIPDATPAGISSPVAIAGAGAVTKVIVRIDGITHTYDGDLDIFLVGPNGVSRELSTDNGSDADYTATNFIDGSPISIVDGASPFSSVFAPEASLATTAGTDFLHTNAKGTWNLHVVDDGTGDTGTLTGWTLIACVDPTISYCGDNVKDPGEECDDGNANNTDACNNACGITDGCGDGNLDAGEQCDDDNQVSNDGCSATCQIEACPTGSTAFVYSNAGTFAIPDNNTTGVSSPVTVTATGTITRVSVTISNITHTFDGDLDIYLVGPTALKRELSTDNGSLNDNYINTSFDDSATTSITAGTAPFTGTFKPETSLSTTAGTDFRNTSAAGVWNLNVVDDAGGDTGTLNGWTLTVCVAP